MSHQHNIKLNHGMHRMATASILAFQAILKLIFNSGTYEISIPFLQIAHDGPIPTLPLHEEWKDVDSYIEALLLLRDVHSSAPSIYAAASISSTS